MADGWTDVTRRGYDGIRQRGFGPNQGGTENAYDVSPLTRWSTGWGCFIIPRTGGTAMERKKIVILGAGHVGSH